MAMEKPQGWASLTRLHRGDAAPDEPFPSLAPAPKPAGGRRAGAVLQAPFVSAVSKGLASGASGSGVVEAGLSPEDVGVARLREQHGWADDVLVREVLRAVDGDEAMASAQLEAMAGPESPRAGGGEEDGVAGDELRSAGAAECEENDVYLKFRREALRLSRYVCGTNFESFWCQTLSADDFLELKKP
jgi:hypothetical protein